MEKTVEVTSRDVEASFEKPSNVPATANPRDGISNWQWFLICVGLYLGALLYGLDTTIAADLQAQVYESLGHIENLQWVGLGFPLGSVATILALCRAYGVFNVKVLLLSSIVVFEVGSAICGAAPTSDVLIVGRVIAGIGGAGMYLGSLTYVSLFTTHREATLYNALTGLSWGVGCILGPVVGGAFSVSSATWRWGFYINLPLCGLLSPVYIFMFPSRNPRPDLKLKEKLAEIDWVGAVLNGAVFVLFMIVVSFSGSTYAWSSAASITLWAVFALCLVTYVLQQYFPVFTSKEQRIFPAHFLKSRTLILLYFATAGAGVAQANTLFYTPLFFQFTRGDTSLEAAVRLLPFICTFIFFVMVAGGSLPIVGRYNLYYIIGGCLTVAGSAPLCTINETTSTTRIYGCQVVMAAGIGLVFQNAYAVAAAKVSLKDQAKAIGFINVAQIGTIAIGLAVAGCLFQNLGFQALKSGFKGYGFEDAYVRSALAGSISPVFTSADEEVVRIAVVAVAGTIRKVFGTVVAAGAVVVVSGLLMRFEKVDLDVVAGG